MANLSEVVRLAQQATVDLNSDAALRTIALAEAGRESASKMIADMANRLAGEAFGLNGRYDDLIRQIAGPPISAAEVTGKIAGPPISVFPEGRASWSPPAWVLEPPEDRAARQTKELRREVDGLKGERRAWKRKRRVFGAKLAAQAEEITALKERERLRALGETYQLEPLPPTDHELN